MAFDNGAVLEGLQVGRIVPDVLAGTNWKDKKTKLFCKTGKTCMQRSDVVTHGRIK